MTARFPMFSSYEMDLTVSWALYCVITPELKINLAANKEILLCIVGSQRKFIPQINTHSSPDTELLTWDKEISKINLSWTAGRPPGDVAWVLRAQNTDGDSCFPWMMVALLSVTACNDRSTFCHSLHCPMQIQAVQEISHEPLRSFLAP